MATIELHEWPEKTDYFMIKNNSNTLFKLFFLNFNYTANLIFLYHIKFQTVSGCNSLKSIIYRHFFFKLYIVFECLKVNDGKGILTLQSRQTYNTMFKNKLTKRLSLITTYKTIDWVTRSPENRECRRNLIRRNFPYEKLGSCLYIRCYTFLK